MDVAQTLESEQEESQGIDAPWFVTYNPMYRTLHSTKLHLFSPFPVQEFCAHSPWEDHLVVAHFGIEAFAHAAGFDRVDEFLLDRIATSPKHGSFCSVCPSKSCPEKTASNRQ